MKNIMKAAVYCGTYNKYNNGSIAGAWINLADYSTKKKFYAACKELHKDEPDPEFMFQDWENIPTSMVGESHVDDEIWHVINSIKKYAPDKADEFAEWCDENGMEQDYKALSEFMGYKKDPKPKKGKKNDLQMSKENILKALDDAGVKGYNRERVSNAAYIHGRLVLFYRPSIDTSFCFDDENEAAMAMYREFCKNSETAHKHFIDINKRQQFTHLNFLNGGDDMPYYWRGKDLFISGYKGDGYCSIYVCDETDFLSNEKYDFAPEKLTPDEKEQYRKLLLLEKQKFEDRLNAYIKRYGVTKCRYWTYWANA